LRACLLLLLLPSAASHCCPPECKAQEAMAATLITLLLR
jgi:hypothetical protein